MIVLKPKNWNRPAMLEGKFKSLDADSTIYFRVSTVYNIDTSVAISLEVNGLPVIQGKKIRSSDGWVDVSYKVGALNTQFVSIVLKVYPNRGKSSKYSYLFIDEMSLEGTPLLNNNLSIVKHSIETTEESAAFINVHGLWADLKGREYRIRQTGNSFTFSASKNIDGALWKIDGSGEILSEKKIKISFTEDFSPSGRKHSYTTTGEYKSRKKIIYWNLDHDRFPSIWLFIR